MSALAPVPSSQAIEPYEGDIPNAASAGQSRAATVGSEFKHQAREWLALAGARFICCRHRVGAYNVEGVICGANGQNFIILAHGVLDDGGRAGLKRTDTLKKAGFDAVMIRQLRTLPILLVTSHLPEGGAAASQLADCAPFIFDVFATNGDFASFQRLQRYLHEEPFPGQLPAVWRNASSHWAPELFDGEDQPVDPQFTFSADIDADGEEAF